MADTQYIRPNKLKKQTPLRLGLAIGLSAAAVILFAAGAVLAAGLVLLIVPFVFFMDLGTIAEEGAKGEDATMEILSRLPDSYTIFNQTNIPNKESRTGLFELDFIVVGPNGVFVVEVKHNNSTIYGKEEAREWTVLKMGKGGTPYIKAMRNPIKQAKKQVWALSGFLREKNHRAWIEGIVFFSNPASSLEIEEKPTFPVIHCDGLVEYIQSYRPKHPPKDLPGIVRDIQALRQ